MCWLLLSVLLAGCAPAPSTCVPGQVVDCPCAAGVRGAQTCGADGRFGSCACLGVDAGTDSSDAAVTEATAPEAAADVHPEAATCPDRDNDGHGAMPCGDDCDDSNPRVRPGQLPRCDATLSDSDCNGTPDAMEQSEQSARCALECRTIMGRDCAGFSTVLCIATPSDRLSCRSCRRGEPQCVCWNSGETGTRSCAPLM